MAKGFTTGPASYNKTSLGDAALSFTKKVSRWPAEPKTAVQLLSNVLTSVLAIGVASTG